MFKYRHELSLLLALTACTEGAGPRDTIEINETQRTQPPEPTWAGVIDGRLSSQHCWTPNGEGALLVIGFDGSVENTAGVFELDAALDGIPLAAVPQGSGRFVAVALPSTGIDPGFHTLTVSGSVDAEVTILHPQAGDANCDGRFASDDLVAIFEAGHYESPDAEGEVGWAEGDFNGDGLVGSGDLVAAYSAGNYESEQPYADAGAASWVLRSGEQGTMTSTAEHAPSIVDVLEATIDVEIVVTPADLDPAEDLYTVAYPLQELPEFRIGVRLDAAEIAMVESEGSLSIPIDFGNARYTTFNKFNVLGLTVLEDLDAGDLRTVCGDVWFRGDDGVRTFVGRGTTEPMQMFATTVAGAAKKAPKPGGGGGLGGLLGGLEGLKEVIELLPLDTCGVYIPFGACPATVCAHSRKEKVAFSYCSAGTYGVTPGTVNQCACL